MLNLILFGPPGSGKGTQSCRVARRFNLVHLSTGDLFRAEVRKGTELGLQLAKYMRKGLLVPDTIVLKKLYQSAMEYCHSPGLIFDGFPRTINQALTLDKLLEKKNIPVDIVFFMVVDEHELISRMLGRAEDSGRLDDNEKIIYKRMEVYEQQTRPLKDYYQHQNKLSCISGMAPVDIVSERIAKVIEHYNHKKEILSNVRE